MTVNTLPKILTIDSIESYEGAVCPHCGAEGKHVYWFTTEDGKRGGAMSGCIQLFPQSRFFDESKRIADKKKRYAKEGWNLPHYDRIIDDTLRNFASGAITEDEASSIIRDAKHNAEMARRRRNQKRRGW